MDTYELHTEAQALADTMSNYEIAKMYVLINDKEKHLLAEIEKWKYMLEECEAENEEYRKQISVLRGA